MEIVREIESLAAQGRFDEMSDLLRQLLSSAWDEATQEAIELALEAITGDEFTADLVTSLLDAFDTILSGDHASRVAADVIEVSATAYRGGQVEITSGIRFGLVDRRATAWLGEYHSYWIRNHYGDHVSSKVREVATEALEQGLSRVDAGRLFQERLSETFGQSESYWRLTADAVVTQSRSFGQVSSYEQLGVEEYEIDAVIDRRTSTICRHLDGVRFKVADAVDLRNRMMQAKTPEEARALSPWPSEDKVVGKSPEQLARMGLLFPPYHGFCRTRTVIVSPRQP